ncbi:MAG: radical SAM family heme chaperone HemW [Desulfuromusa sp.]|jgi:oxygen-independent coproporphyrinogen-3 oxidase|nr:radical SAM family heme chaperone HemW [Desulfuromusa sp.]
MSSLYVHIPFCASKCPYCDFFSQVGSQQHIDEYVELLNLNIEILKRNSSPSPPFSTIFFGGGTPSLLSSRQIESILNSLEQNFGIAMDAEITLEANPGTVDLAKLQGYRQAGVNRLSLGIQSLTEKNLKLLGRIHSVKQARESIFAARTAGFDNLSLDLMFALPSQDLRSLEQEVSALLNLNPEHISLYGLSFEEGTEFSLRRQSGELASCGDNLYADQYQLLHDQLVAADYEHYEISNFAQPGQRCRHNQIYWQRRNCLAIGAGAHSFIEQGWGERWHIPTNLQKYKESLLQGENPAELLETYDHQGAMREFVYLALRTSGGADLHEFKRRFERPMEEVFSVALKNTGKYLHSNNDHYSFEQTGWLLYDHLISHFL